MLALYRRIERVARFDVLVLILGETGTGKELVARAIVNLGARRDRAFEPINGGALSPELVLSELFGHERGAFTGAVSSTQGLLTAANGGTLFLDEVGDLPLEIQVKLLRFLQDGEIRRVGSTQARRVDVRLIAATHRDLAAAVGRGAFREDLYYRLRRVALEVPPLRARREDIPLLVGHVVRRLNAEHGLRVRGATREALELLQRHPWPGNVRELEAVVEGAMILGDGVWIRPEDIEFPPRRDDRPIETIADQPTLGAEGITWLQNEALRIASSRGEVRRRDLVARGHTSESVVRRQLAELVLRGLLRRIGQGRGARYVPVP